MAYTSKLFQSFLLAGGLLTGACQLDPFGPGGAKEGGGPAGGETAPSRADGRSDGRPSPYDDGCTYTQGYWKNHSEAWPVASLKLGATTYDKGQLLAILRQPVAGNGLVSLAHQLIAARLNAAAGAATSDADQLFADADALIGSLVVPPVGQGKLPTGQTSKLNDALTGFNEGKVGPGHCDREGGPKPPPGGSTPYPPGGSDPQPPPAADAGPPPPPPGNVPPPLPIVE